MDNESVFLGLLKETPHCSECITLKTFTEEKVNNQNNQTEYICKYILQHSMVPIAKVSFYNKTATQVIPIHHSSTPEAM